MKYVFHLVAIQIRPMASIPHAVYFWFSLIFLISRTLALSLYSSKVYDESQKSLNVLRAVPNWCIEVRRFVEQVVNDTIALTGMRFFYLTRKLILSVAGVLSRKPLYNKQMFLKTQTILYFKQNHFVFQTTDYHHV